MIEQSVNVVISADYTTANLSMVGVAIERLCNLVDFYDEDLGTYVKTSSNGTHVAIGGNMQVLWPGCYAKLEEHIELSLAMVGEIVGEVTQVEAIVIGF